MEHILCFSCFQRAPLMVDGSYQSLEALPIEHLQIVFVASSSCSDDETPGASSPNTTACPQRPATKKNPGLTNGSAKPALSAVQGSKTKDRNPLSKIPTVKRLTSKDRERAKKPGKERITRLDEEGLDTPPDGWPLRRVISIEEDHLPHLLHGGPQPLLHQLSEEEAADEVQSDMESSVVDLSATPPSGSSALQTDVRNSFFARVKKTPTSPRGQPVGKETQQVRPILDFKIDKMLWIPVTKSMYNIFSPQKTNEGTVLPPDRLFKVVLVGNSSVGKTSLLRSFCEGPFHPPSTATVGERMDTTKL